MSEAPLRHAGGMRSALPRSKSAAAIAIAGSLALGVSACGSSAKKPDAQASQGGSTLAAVWPLTGEPVTGQLPKYPVVAVKIPNTSEASPQAGMADADMVSEELVEGGITRLAVFFYSKIPSLAGPVRSMRASDIPIVRPLHATIVSSGAAPVTLHRLTRAGVPFFTGGTGYFRDSGRIAPYNLMVHLKDLVKSLRPAKEAATPYLPWGQESDFTGTVAAKSIAVRMSGFRTSLWKWAGNHYVNTNSYAPAGSQFLPDTVLVLRVKEGNAGYLDPAGNPVPETKMTGKGQALVFHGGKLERGIWSKDSVDAPLNLTTKTGAAMKIPAGHVFLELTPINKDGGGVSWTKR